MPYWIAAASLVVFFLILIGTVTWQRHRSQMFEPGWDRYAPIVLLVTLMALAAPTWAALGPKGAFFGILIPLAIAYIPAFATSLLPEVYKLAAKTAVNEGHNK